jgi:uncharacterized surface protein with fasciclin (FAS1) repeats
MRNRKALAMTAALAAGSLFIAACGSDADESAPTTVAAAPQTTAVVATDTTAAPTAETTAAPTTETTAATATTAAPAPSGNPDIVDAAVANGSFNTLVAAVTAAELVEVLKGEGPFTVFAPTDDAFANVPGVTIEALLHDTPVLAGVLTYHVLPGKFMSSDLTVGEKFPTAAGPNVLIKAGPNGGLKINNANVIASDIVVSNGVIHVVDSVIFPEDI